MTTFMLFYRKKYVSDIFDLYRFDNPKQLKLNTPKTFTTNEIIQGDILQEI